MKIIAILALSIAGASHLLGQNFDNYKPRGRNPDLYEINPDGTCPMSGAARASTPDGEKKVADNMKRNRWDFPSESDFDSRVTLTAMLAQGNDLHRFKEGRAARITGYVVSCKSGGRAHRNPPQHSGESCNCGATSPVDTDTHIDVVLDVADRNVPSRHVIVEVTPRIREEMRLRRMNWSTDALRRKLKNHWVEFEGWVFFDPDHLDGSANTNPGGTTNWRATSWEIHPVTSFRVLNGPPSRGERGSPVASSPQFGMP